MPEQSTLWFVQGVGENDFQAAMDAVDAQYLNDIISSSDKNSDVATDVSVKDDGTTEEDVQVGTFRLLKLLYLFTAQTRMLVCVLYACECERIWSSDLEWVSIYFSAVYHQNVLSVHPGVILILLFFRFNS